jgi:hypothetical protein
MSIDDTSVTGYTERHGIRFMEINPKMTGKINVPDSIGTMLPGGYVAEADPDKFLPFAYMKIDLK